MLRWLLKDEGLATQAGFQLWPETATGLPPLAKLIFRCITVLCLLLGTTSQAQTAYGNVAIGGGGYVTGVIGCPNQQNLFYAKTDVGGAYRWDEPTQSWIPLLDWNSQDQTTYQGVESIAIDPQTPSKLYILAGTSYWNGGNTAILRSSDYGNSFSLTDVTSKFKANGNGGDRQKGEGLAVDPNLGTVLFCGTRANGLWKSTDAGVTWNAVSSLNVGGSSISFVKFDPQSGSIGAATPRLFVGVFRTGTNLFVSNNGGSTWTALTNSPANSMPERCELAGDRNLYITYGVDPNGALMKYNVTNGTWFNCSPSGGMTYCGISICATNPNKLVATSYSEWLQQPWGWGDRIFLSTNGGTNWTDLFANNRISMDVNGFPWIVNHAVHWAGALQMDPFNGDRVFVGSGNGIFCTTNLKSGNTTSTWKFMVKGLEETVPLDFISVPGGLFVTSVGDVNGFVHTNIAVPPAAGISQASGFAYAGNKTNFVAMVAGTSFFYSQTWPANWIQCPSPADTMTNGSVAVSADGSTFLWKTISGGTHKCYVTTNRGSLWTAATGLTFTCKPVGDTVNSTKFYAYNPSDGYMYVSSNGGLSFSRAGSVGSNGSSTFEAAPGLEGHIWVALGGSGLKYCTNSGGTFYSAGVYRCDAMALGATAPGAGYPTVFIWGQPTSSSVVGMYKSTTMGGSWVRVNDSAHQYGGRGNAGLIEGDKNVHGRVYMSSAGRGVLYMDSDVVVTGVTLSPTAWAGFVTASNQLIATVFPANATYPSVTWASTNPLVASVSLSGWVTGNTTGTTLVTATALDGGYVSGCVVTITNLLTPPVLTLAKTNGSSFVLSWPADHRGWVLLAQTNPPGSGLSTNWFIVPNSNATNSYFLTPDSANSSVFWRLVSP